ncbi:hypothetical protein JJB07_08675 [Tumebacillus sp. ITR2]|uniref:DUF2935 domain-containing protein n=1 Tax=Tumebacillus amylolyticus TaxID=2801339 RepID=A0ABS1J8Y0_9BACL|nr:halocarboxylic acid dehydrogenase DehI family protein [Tumebacillus amylolyticus]MBL0386725.1 hypothetical protein [Tumebacillus amylolyticus]
MNMPEISEGEARGRLRQLYHTIKATMRVPLVSEPLRALALYPNFLHLVFEASRPNLLSVHVERMVSELTTYRKPPLQPPPMSTSVLPRDRRGALALLPVFRYETAKLLLLLTAWQETLAERPISGQNHEDAFWPPGILPHFPRNIPLLRIEHATHTQRHVFQNILAAHDLFTLPDVYRALAHHPTFLTGAWEPLHPLVQTDAYEDAARHIRRRAKQLVHALPHPLPLTPNRLLLQVSEREVTAGIGLITAYRHTLPRLLLDVEMMTQMLQV